MPLTATDLTQLGQLPITIMSNFYPNIFLRMDGTGVTAASTPGGTVNCEYNADAKATFIVHPQANGSYAFESTAFPGVYLRMDGTGVPTTMAGGGTVNCSFGIADAKETFIAHANADGSFSFESGAFPGIFLRMVTGSGVTTATGPGGTVNCQINASGGANESFFLNIADQSLNNYAIQLQSQNMWCWNAVSVAVALFYTPTPPGGQPVWTQCALANTVFGQQNNACCNLVNGVSPCNWGCWPDASSNGGGPGPLQAIGHYNGTLTYALSVVQLGTQMANSAPVVCNITWDNNAGGHIVALHGRYTVVTVTGTTVSTVDYVNVGDPWDGEHDITYTSFRRYQGNGTWDHSYPTH